MTKREWQSFKFWVFNPLIISLAALVAGGVLWSM